MKNYLGIHVARRQPKFYYCLISGDLEVRVLEKGYEEEVLAYASSEATQISAVDAPSMTNAGLMQEESVRSQFNPPPTANRWMDLRFGEYELVRKRMKITRTSMNKGACPQWIQNGIDLHQHLEEMGYLLQPAAESKFRIEVPGEAAFHSLLGNPLLSEKTTEGRIQRQLLLWRLGLQIEDPMLMFEEVTRHRLERGNFPFRSIYSIEQLYALVAAYTAWLFDTRPDQIQSFGKQEEGVLSLPVRLI